MTRVDFYTHVADRDLVVCRICDKASASGQRVHVVTDGPASTERLSRRLWSYTPLSFVPHCSSQDPLAADTPVLIDHGPPQFHHYQVLINLQAEVPTFFARFERLVEVVDLSPEVREPARKRFTLYKDRGYDIHTHKLGD